MRAKITKNERKVPAIRDHAAENSIDSAVLLYRASWVDRLIHWIKRLPVPSWLFYLSIFSILTLFIHFGYWIYGYTSLGRYDSLFLYRIVAIYPVMILAAIHYIDNSARRSFDEFRPALGKSETETVRLRYELTTMPSRQVWAATAIGMAFGLFVIFFGNYRPIVDNTPVVFGMVLIIAIFGFIMTGIMFYHTVRQLRLVSHIHSVAADINLLHTTPLHAFSRLSAHTGLFFILNLYFDLVANAETLKNLGLLVLNVIGLPLIAAACFILPIQGMHRRLVLEKRRLQWEVNQRLEASVKQLYQRVDAADLRDADAMNKTILSLITTRDLIAKIPTWPWQPETSALFFSALTLPVIVFLIQILLNKLFGF